MRWDEGEVRPMAVTALGERYRRYRWADASAEEVMASSLRRWGQMTPIAVCWREGQAELLDGFKRRAAAFLLGWTTLSVRVLAVDERTAKAAILGLNYGAAPLRELEEAWLVQALVREDGLSQVEAAALLGRHKSWVCRRLALLERLAGPMQEEVRLGLLSTRLARRLVQLPACNQETLMAATRRDSLTAEEVCGLVDVLVGASPEQERFVLAQPREALRQAQAERGPLRDPRLSPAGNWLARQLGSLRQALGRLESWLRHPGKYELRRLDRDLLRPSLERLGAQTRDVAEVLTDFLLSLAAS
jgi:ParB/RepB/Spo0J family partition protein